MAPVKFVIHDYSEVFKISRERGVNGAKATEIERHREKERVRERDMRERERTSLTFTEGNLNERGLYLLVKSTD